MPESGVTKHNYLLCQFINPARGHEGEHCDCYDTPSQKRTTLAKQRLICLRANRNVNRASTSGTQESAVTSDPAVTLDVYNLQMDKGWLSFSLKVLLLIIHPFLYSSNIGID
jgi:hypothetical protein